MFRRLKALVLVLVFSTLTAAQAVSEKNATEQEDKLRKEAITFLRETLTDVNSMRSLENRISFAAEIASIMWYYDEREARSMYVGVITDFRDLLGRYESQIRDLGPAGEDEDTSARMVPLMFDPTERVKLQRKFSTAMGVRHQIAMSMSEHDPDLAFGFYYDSLSSISHPDLRTFVDGPGGRDSYFESQLLGQLIEKDAAKGAKYAKRSVERGVTYQHIDLLKKLYAKNPEKGVEFGQAVLSKMKGEGENLKEFYVLSNLIDFGAETIAASRKPEGKRALYTEAEIRELVEVLAQAVLKRDASDSSQAYTYIGTIQKYLPGRAAQIRAKFGITRTPSNTNAAAANRGFDFEEMGPPPDYAGSVSNANVNSSSLDPAARRRMEREEAEKKLFEDVQGLGAKELPTEEREKIIASVRKIIATTPGRDKKILALSALAAQVAKLGDKELAGEIMRDAERLVNPTPKNVQDFLLSWMLATGYASADPDKAFPILEETIGRANETLAAFIKVGEFIDVAEEVVQDGELQVGAFGGQMVRGLTKELGMADATIEVLARADFTKTKNLTNRFDRTEIRILAKMMVLRAVLKPKTSVNPEELVEGGPVK